MNTRQVDDITIVDFDGRITLSKDFDSLPETLREMASRGQKKVLLNLAEVNYIDSSGLGALVSGYTTLTNQQGQLRLLNLTKKVNERLRITKLLTIFEVFDDEAAAIRSFRS